MISTKASDRQKPPNPTIAARQGQIAPQTRVKQEVTKRDILEFSGQPSEELQQSGQINIVTGGGAASSLSNYPKSRMNVSDSGSQNGNKPRPVARDNSIIERNKAKLAALTEKKLQEKREKEAKEQK